MCVVQKIMVKPPTYSSSKHDLFIHNNTHVGTTIICWYRLLIPHSISNVIPTPLVDYNE